MAILKSLLDNPEYALMRGVARFEWVRNLVVFFRHLAGYKQTGAYEHFLQSQMKESMFSEINPNQLLSHLRVSGTCLGLDLPPDLVDQIMIFAKSNVTYAFRDSNLGFDPQNLSEAEQKLGKEILLSQYFNAQENCNAIDKIATDPLIRWIALKYLGCVPKYFGAVLWWTYPIKPNREDQIKHAHFFHRDIDDFKFLKFFFYINEVEKGDGGHWVVPGSHRKPPRIRFKDHFLLRRFEDEEITNFYGKAKITEVFGPKGTGFAEDTLCIHKAATPSRKPRLVLQLQFGLFDLIPEKSNRNFEELRMIP